MEELVKEMREDIKAILTSQARIEERMRAHSEEMHEHKEKVDADIKELKIETKLQIQGVQEKMSPLLRSYNGAKWSIGAFLTVGAIAAAYAKFL